MFRRKRGRKPEQPPSARPPSPADEIRAAFSEFSEASRLQRPDRRAKRRHVDDYRELVIEQGADLSQALADLTRETHDNRHRLLDEEAPPLRLPGDRAGEATLDPQHEADVASREIKGDYDRLGLQPPTHYYSSRERRDTGEIDRTYRLGPPRKHPRKRPR